MAKKPPKIFDRRSVFFTFLSGIAFAACFWILFQISNKLGIFGNTPNSDSAFATGEVERYKTFGNYLAEKQLFEQAIKSYQHYLEEASLSAKAQAKIHYQIGSLFDQANQWENALAHYYRSKILAADLEFANLRERKIIACFERLGRLQDAEYALTSATALDPTKKDNDGQTPIAKIQSQSFYMKDIDAIIALLPEEEQLKLQNLAAKKEFAKQFIANQILLRKAKKLNLHQDKNFRLRLKWVTDELLLQTLFDHERKQQIRLDSADIENYYKANQKRFAEPARAKISHILLAKEAEASSILLQIQSNQISFVEAAQKYSLDLKTKEQGGELKEWIVNYPQHPVPFLGETSSEFLQLVFQTQEGQIASKPVKTGKGYHLLFVHETTSERIRPFEEVKEQVTAYYKMEKLQSLKAKLFQESFQSTEVTFFEEAFQTKK